MKDWNWIRKLLAFINCKAGNHAPRHWFAEVGKMKGKILHTKYENVVRPFNKNHIAGLEEMSKIRGYKCVECGEVPRYEQFSPDLGTLLFCSKKCYEKFNDENIYRAMPLKEVK